MPAGAPQVALGDVGGVDKLVAILQVGVLPEALNQVSDERSMRVPEDEAGACMVADAEQVQLLAQLPVISAPGSLTQNSAWLQFYRLEKGSRWNVNRVPVIHAMWCNACDKGFKADMACNQVLMTHTWSRTDAFCMLKRHAVSVVSHVCLCSCRPLLVPIS